MDSATRIQDAIGRYRQAKRTHVSAAETHRLALQAEVATAAYRDLARRALEDADAALLRVIEAEGER